MYSKLPHKVFLLGGSDLEMHTIKDILEENHLTCMDAHLKWNNACLSQYEHVLTEKANDPSVMFYGIELVEDITPPTNYERIDHHNDYSNRPASVLQVLDIIHQPVSRFHELVAANDTAYIPGMQKIKATDEEIDTIRRLDRKYQGVSELDEQCAIDAIHHNLEKKGRLTLVNTRTCLFSTITDRLFPFTNLLIYTDKEATYYGEEVARLKELFKAEIEQHKMYYGGNDGFFGVAKDALTQTEFNTFIQLLIDLHK